MLKYKHDVGILTLVNLCNLVAYSIIYAILQFSISGCDTQ
jgi:hypothetical protein